jgi:hypothetical protein
LRLEVDIESSIHEGQRTFTGGSMRSARLRSATFTGPVSVRLIPESALHLRFGPSLEQSSRSTTSGP